MQKTKYFLPPEFTIDIQAVQQHHPLHYYRPHATIHPLPTTNLLEIINDNSHTIHKATGGSFQS